MIDPQSTLTTVTAALTAIKTLVGIARERKDTELTDKIIDLQTGILELQSALAEYKKEINSLREELVIRKQEQAIDRELE